MTVFSQWSFPLYALGWIPSRRLPNDPPRIFPVRSTPLLLHSDSVPCTAEADLFIPPWTRHSCYTFAETCRRNVIQFGEVQCQFGHAVQAFLQHLFQLWRGGCIQPSLQGNGTLGLFLVIVILMCFSLLQVRNIEVSDLFTILFVQLCHGCQRRYLHGANIHAGQ